jgi:hypothetical protein
MLDEIVLSLAITPGSHVLIATKKVIQKCVARNHRRRRMEVTPMGMLAMQQVGISTVMTLLEVLLPTLVIAAVGHLPQLLLQRKVDGEMVVTTVVGKQMWSPLSL